MIFLCTFLLYILSFHNRGSNVPLMALKETDCQDSCQYFSFKQLMFLHEYFLLKIKYCLSELGIQESLSNVRIRHAKTSNMMSEDQIFWSSMLWKPSQQTLHPQQQLLASTLRTHIGGQFQINLDLKKQPLKETCQ